VRVREGTGAEAGREQSGAKREDHDGCAREREFEEETEDEEGRLGLRLFPDERGKWKPKDESDEAIGLFAKGEVAAEDRTPDQGKVPQGVVWSGLRCRRAKGDMVVVVVGVAASEREE
jgi:hypothetical protein